MPNSYTGDHSTNKHCSVIQKLRFKQTRCGKSLFIRSLSKHGVQKQSPATSKYDPTTPDGTRASPIAPIPTFVAFERTEQIFTPFTTLVQTT